MENLRDIRKRLGISQAKAAYLLGTKQENISSYERGARMPGPLVEHRIRLLGGLSTGSAYVGGPYATMPALALRIKQDVVPNDDVPWGIRLVAQAMSDFARLRTESDRLLFLAPPGTTGHAGWDALLAGVAEMLVNATTIPHPRWAYGKELPGFWWMTGTAGMEPSAYMSTPPELRVRGVLVDRASLESV